MAKIALVHPSYTHKAFSENLRVVDEEFCHAPPIILAYIASILRSHGHQVILIDAHTLKLTAEEVVSILKDFAPDFLAFRLESYHFLDSITWIRLLKNRLKIPVIAGGVNFTLYPEETLSYPEIDYGIVGDAIEALPKLLEAISNAADFQAIPGVAYRQNGKVVINSHSKQWPKFETYPFPARDLLPNEKYYSFLSKRKNFTIMLTTRGCPYRCVFCAIPATPYEERSPINVVDEIEECYLKYHIREIDFFDAVFFFNKKRFIEISNEIIRRGIKIEWSCRSRVDLVDEEILKAASLSGCRQILFGIESSSQMILDNIKKGINIEQVKIAIALCQKYKILTLGFFMLGNPGESEFSIKETIAMAKKLGLDFSQFCMTIAKPNSELNNILKDKLQADYWREHTLGRRNGCRLPTPWTSLSAQTIERYTRKAYRSFYLRPGYIANRLRRVKSFEELIKYIRVGAKMLFGNYKH